MDLELHWVRQKDTSWQLHTLSGVKVWLVLNPKRGWVVCIGDMPDRKYLPLGISVAEAKRRTLVLVNGYLQELIRQIIRFNK